MLTPGTEYNIDGGSSLQQRTVTRRELIHQHPWQLEEWVHKSWARRSGQHTRHLLSTILEMAWFCLDHQALRRSDSLLLWGIVRISRETDDTLEMGQCKEGWIIGLAQKFGQVFCNILWKNPNKLFGQPNTMVLFAKIQVRYREEQGCHVTITIPRLEERKEEEDTGTRRANTMQRKPCKKEQRLSLRSQSVSSKFSQRGIQSSEYTKLILCSWLLRAQPNQAREPIAVVHLGQPPGTEKRKEEEWMDIELQVETIWHSFRGNFIAQNHLLSR